MHVIACVMVMLLMRLDFRCSIIMRIDRYCSLANHNCCGVVSPHSLFIETNVDFVALVCMAVFIVVNFIVISVVRMALFVPIVLVDVVIASGSSYCSNSSFSCHRCRKIFV